MAPSSQCVHLVHPNPLTVSLASFILLGILVSYIPQHLKIITRRSSDGLSPWWVLLGGLSSIGAIANILVLPQSRADLKCCKEVTGGECAAALLGVAQIGLQWGCFMFIVFLFLIFFPATNVPPATDMTASLPSLSSLKPDPHPPRRRDAIIVTTTILLTVLATFITSLAIVSAYPHHTQTWADFLGTVAGTLAAIQYIPQIYFTFAAKEVRSLSIVTMIIQVPGAFLFAFSLWLRVGWKGWSTWLVYVVTGILQAILLSLAVKYYLDARRKGKQETAEQDDEISDDEEEPATERTALIGNGNDSARRQQDEQRKSRPIQGTGTQRSQGSGRGLDMLYAATPPEHDSDSSR